MKMLWKPSTEKIGKYPCIQLGEGEDAEFTLSGKNGEIWVDKGDRLKAIVIRSPSGRKLPNEQLVRFGIEDLDKWVERLEVPYDPRDQTPYANTFGR